MYFNKNQISSFENEDDKTNLFEITETDNMIKLTLTLTTDWWLMPDDFESPMTLRKMAAFQLTKDSRQSN